MYFKGTLAIDPSQITKIETVKPTKAFGKLFYFLTAGKSGDKEEQETFTALAVMQQLNMVVRSVGVNNVVRLAQDDHDFYLDEEGKQDDLREALDEYQISVDEIESELFKSLYLVLEHEDHDLKYLLEIQVKRKHKLGEYPISMTINGIVNDLRLLKDERPPQLERRMQQVFQSQDSYNSFVRNKRSAFDTFLNELEQATRKFIKVDDIVKKSDTEIIRPKKRVKEREQIRQDHHGQPVYYGYHGFNDGFLYAWMWSSMLHSNNIYVNDVTVVDEAGDAMMQVGEEGFNAGDSNALNPEESFEAPGEGDIDYQTGHDYESEFSDASVDGWDSGGDSGLDSDASSSWVDSWTGGGSDFGGSDSSCSSCSSCGGCGGD